MKENIPETLSPEECGSKIFELSGVKFEPDIALDLWGKILQHKWLLSEKVGRDVGFRTACIDFLKNMEQAVVEYTTYKQRDILKVQGIEGQDPFTEDENREYFLSWVEFPVQEQRLKVVAWQMRRMACVETSGPCSTSSRPQPTTRSGRRRCSS